MWGISLFLVLILLHRIIYRHHLHRSIICLRNDFRGLDCDGDFVEIVLHLIT